MSSGFVSEGDLEAARQKRQEEWDRVRTAEEPEKAPEEPYDSRSLFDRLEENKRKKQEEYDREHDIKRVVRGIDDDEASFLDHVDDLKSEMECNRMREEQQALEEYRKQKDKLLEEETERKRKAELEAGTKKSSTTSSSIKSQKLLLSGIVKKRKDSSSNSDSGPPVKQTKNEINEKQPPSNALAGLGDYSSSEESDAG